MAISAPPQPSTRPRRPPAPGAPPQPPAPGAPRQPSARPRQPPGGQFKDRPILKAEQKPGNKNTQSHQRKTHTHTCIHQHSHTRHTPHKPPTARTAYTPYPLHTLHPDTQIKLCTDIHPRNNAHAHTHTHIHACVFHDCMGVRQYAHYAKRVRCIGVCIGSESGMHQNRVCIGVGIKCSPCLSICVRAGLAQSHI